MTLGFQKLHWRFHGIHSETLDVHFGNAGPQDAEGSQRAPKVVQKSPKRDPKGYLKMSKSWVVVAGIPLVCLLDILVIRFLKP